MTIIKRLYTSFSAGVDHLVSEIENHEATIGASINDYSKKLSEAKVHLNRLRSTEQQAEETRTKLVEAEVLWTERAQQEAGKNEEKALLCLQRRQSIREKIQQSTASLAAYRKAIAVMEGNLQRSEDELVTLKQKHELMRARQVSANVSEGMNDLGETLANDLGRSFDRWEAGICHKEIQSGPVDDIDSLEQEYLSKEREGSLKAELDELMAGKQEVGHG